jgi:comEA protein
MLVLTSQEKKALLILVLCFLLGIALYWWQERELVVGKEIVAPQQKELPVKKKPAVININEASQAELEEIPGIGSAMAQRIIDYRKTHRRFYKKEELKHVQGIGEKRFQEIEHLIEVR